ncbi:MAG: ABC transporter ATP-binding protein [Phycisphaeraceae bacterium]
MSDQPVIETKQLTKKYGDFTALDNLSIRLNRGEILGFIGPNGAGKTTTIKILVGLARATSGEARVAGLDCSNDIARLKRAIGYMPDTFGSYDNMRVHEYLDFFGAAFQLPRDKRRKRIEEVLEITGSTYMRDRYVESLSHGMKQRVGIARTLLHDPQVLILDEPANGLDPQARIEMRQLLLRLADMGKTLIVTSHILPELSRICNVVAIITHGKLRAFGSLDNIMRLVRQRRLMQVILVKKEQVESMAAFLKMKLGDDAQITASEQESEIRFSTNETEESLAGLLSEAMQQGLMLAQFHEVPMDLEDAFLSVTRAAPVPAGV